MQVLVSWSRISRTVLCCPILVDETHTWSGVDKMGFAMDWLLLEERDARRISVCLSVGDSVLYISLRSDPNFSPAEKRLIDFMQGLNQDLLVKVLWAIYR